MLACRENAAFTFRNSSFDTRFVFKNYQKMEKTVAIEAFAALGHQVRMDAFRLLSQAHPHGMTAGDLATALNVNLATLYFHLSKLRTSGLVSTRSGRPETYLACDAILAQLAECLDGLRPAPANDARSVAALSKVGALPAMPRGPH